MTSTDQPFALEYDHSSYRRVIAGEEVILHLSLIHI